MLAKPSKSGCLSVFFGKMGSHYKAYKKLIVCSKLGVKIIMTVTVRLILYTDGLLLSGFFIHDCNVGMFAEDILQSVWPKGYT